MAVQTVRIQSVSARYVTYRYGNIECFIKIPYDFFVKYYLRTRRVMKIGIIVSIRTQGSLVAVGMVVAAMTSAKMVARPNSKKYS